MARAVPLLERAVEVLDSSMGKGNVLAEGACVRACMSMSAYVSHVSDSWSFTYTHHHTPHTICNRHTRPGAAARFQLALDHLTAGDYQGAHDLLEGLVERVQVGGPCVSWGCCNVWGGVLCI